MSGKNPRHTHKYYRVEIAGTKVWACALPTCTHYMPKHMESMMPGKMSRCWICDETFVLDKNTNMHMEQPICDSCIALSERRVDEIRNKKVSDEDAQAAIDKLIEGMRK